MQINAKNSGRLLGWFYYSVGFSLGVTNRGPFTNDGSSSMTVVTWVRLGHRKHLVITKQIKRTCHHHVRAMERAVCSHSQRTPGRDWAKKNQVRYLPRNCLSSSRPINLLMFCLFMEKNSLLAVSVRLSEHSYQFLSLKVLTVCCFSPSFTSTVTLKITIIKKTTIFWVLSLWHAHIPSLYMPDYFRLSSSMVSTSLGRRH